MVLCGDLRATENETRRGRHRAEHTVCICGRKNPGICKRNSQEEAEPYETDTVLPFLTHESSNVM